MRIWKRLLGTALCLCAAVCLMSVSASAAEHNNHPVCGETHTDIGDHTGPCGAVEWIKVMQTDVTDNNGLKLEAGKSYYLGEDISVKYDITIKGTVNLCLNGHSITKTLESSDFMGVITVEAGSSFTLCDCNGSGAGNGKLTHADNVTGRGVLVGSSEPKQASFIMYGGTISGNHINNGQNGAGVRVHSASFKMYGGTISGNSATGDGGGVNAHNSGKFIMYGGEISRNTSNGDGGGVGLVAASFQMSGGTISGNNATYGGGVGLWNDSFTLSGGSIINNKATSGGGVYFKGDTLTISDTMKIEGNTATSNGGGVYFNGDTFNVSGNVSITGNKGGATSTGSGLTGGTDNNVYLPDGKTIAVAGALTGDDKIGVTTENTPDDSMYVQIASGNKDYATPDKFRYENNDTTVSAVVSGRTTKLVACRHNWSSEWKTDTYQHWHVCSICNGKKDVSAHTYDQNVAQESYKASDANCVSPARYYTSCVCGAKDADTFESGEKDPANHRGALGDWQSDENNHWKEYPCCQVRAGEGIHQWDDGKITTPATRTTAGVKTFTCTVCHRTKTETVSATGHNWSAAWRHDPTHHWHECGNANCDVTENSAKGGYGPHSGGTANCTQQAVCTICGTAYGALDANGHDWSQPSYDWNGTSCTAERVCSRDGSHKETETVTAAVTVTQHQSCLLDELSTYTASFQNTAFAAQTKENVVTANKLGHDFESGTWQSDGDHHWKKCSRCDVTDEANKAPHNWDAGVIKTQPTCTTAGEKTYTCTVCNRTKTEAIEALKHDWGEWRVTKPATTSTAGEETRTCKRDASHTETRAIPKLTPAPSGGGSSSGSSSAPAITITVPVSGSSDTVHVSASVSGSTAEVKAVKSAELDKIGTDSAVVIDLSGLNKGVTGVTLSTDTIDSICKTEADGVTIKLPSAELRVDRQTLAAVTEQAAGSKLRLVVEPDGTARSTMTAAQKSTLAGMKNAAALEAYFVSGGTRIRDFKGGSVELSIPYRADGAIRAWFLKEDGTREPVSARYDKENAQLILHHFSHYVIEELDSSAAYTVCAKDDSCPLGAFGDLTAAAWYHDGVHYCLENGLMRGVSGGKFLPNGSTTRAQLVTILWRLESSPEPAGTVSFGDVADGAWYAKAVRWAAGSGVVKGYDNGNFGPDDAVTREQMVTILYRFAQHKGYDVSAGEDTNILSFNDALTVSEYAIPAMQWACGSGMVNGIAQEGEMFLAPKDTTTRAQIATLMMRFQGIFTTAV